MTEGKRNIIQGFLQEYNIESDNDTQEALKDLLGGIIKEMTEAEMDDHLGYEKFERSDSDDLPQWLQGKTNHDELLLVNTGPIAFRDAVHPVAHFTACSAFSQSSSIHSFLWISLTHASGMAS